MTSQPHQPRKNIANTAEHRGEPELRITCDKKTNDYDYQQTKTK